MEEIFNGLAQVLGAHVGLSLLKLCRRLFVLFQNAIPRTLSGKFAGLTLPLRYESYLVPAFPFLDTTAIFMMEEILSDKSYFRFFSPKRDETVIDIGANIGIFSICASPLVGEKGKIYAIEPNPHLIGFLKKNTAHLRNVEVLNVGLGNISGDGVLMYNPFATGDGSLMYNAGALRVNVKLLSLDNFVEINKIQRVDFIKLDAEGYELLILKGAIETLKTKQLRLVAEISIQFKEQIVNFLNDLGYKTIEMGLKKSPRNRELLLYASNISEDVSKFDAH